MATTDCKPIYGRDDRLGHLADDAVQAINFEHAHFGFAIATGRGTLLLVTATAKCFRAGAGQDDGAHGFINPGVAKGLNEFIIGSTT